MSLSQETTNQTLEFMYQRCKALQSKLEEVEAKYEVLEQKQLLNYEY